MRLRQANRASRPAHVRQPEDKRLAIAVGIAQLTATPLPRHWPSMRESLDWTLRPGPKKALTIAIARKDKKK